MPSGYDFEGASPLLPDNGVVDGSGMLMQDPQLRDALARMLQAQQGQPPQMPGQMPGGVPQMPGQMPGGVPQMPQPMQGIPNNPDGVPGLGPSSIQPGAPQPNNPDGLPGLGPQSSSAFKLPGKMARLNPLDEVDPRDIVGRGSAGTA